MMRNLVKHRDNFTLTCLLCAELKQYNVVMCRYKRAIKLLKGKSDLVRFSMRSQQPSVVRKEVPYETS
jgi:hypothetical protein